MSVKLTHQPHSLPFIVNESRLEIFTDDPCDKFP